MKDEEVIALLKAHDDHEWHDFPPGFQGAEMGARARAVMAGINLLEGYAIPFVCLEDSQGIIGQAHLTNIHGVRPPSPEGVVDERWNDYLRASAQIVFSRYASLVAIFDEWNLAPERLAAIVALLEANGFVYVRTAIAYLKVEEDCTADGYTWYTRYFDGYAWQPGEYGFIQWLGWAWHGGELPDDPARASDGQPVIEEAGKDREGARHFDDRRDDIEVVGDDEPEPTFMEQFLELHGQFTALLGTAPEYHERHDNTNTRMVLSWPGVTVLFSIHASYVCIPNARDIVPQEHLKEIIDLLHKSPFQNIPPNIFRQVASDGVLIFDRYFGVVPDS